MPRQKYEQIYSILKGQIEAGDYPVGGLLPSENVLQAGLGGVQHLPAY